MAIDKKDLFRIRSEKLINESWSIIDEKFNDLIDLSNRGSIDNEEDATLALISVSVIIQNLVFQRTEDEYYFGDENILEDEEIEIAPCGKSRSCGKCGTECFFL